MIKGVTYILKNDVTFQSLVGQNVALSKYKAYPVICPQPELVPYSVVRMTSKTLQSKGKNSSRNEFEVEFTVASYCNSYDDVDALDNAVIQAIVPYRGTANGITFGYIEFVNSMDEYVETYGGLYARMSSFKANITLDALT